MPKNNDTPIKWTLDMKTSHIASLSLAIIAALAGCNSHPVSPNTREGVVEIKETFNIAGSEQVDILWVIDNSGSMCQEQKVLSDNFDTFIDILNEANVDFHLGVTTSDMNPDYVLEPVASPGRLQSTPQPIPGFDASCQLAVDDNGAEIPGNYQPVKDAIATAVSCTTSQDGSAFNWTNAEIECALLGRPMGCEIASVGCGGANAGCDSADLFPSSSAYRSIPKVLRSQDYLNVNNSLDVARLKADFACMSLVGTRGYGIETGLIAAVEAVSPSNTGGALLAGGEDAATSNTSAPNYGLIRKDARFALIFVTDENDCSHEGARNLDEYLDPDRPPLDTASACSGDICEIVNKEGYPNTPLIPVEELQQQFMENLAATKGYELGKTFKPTEVVVASLHGASKRFAGDIPTEEQCGDGGSFPGISPSCVSANGRAYSGDRYDRFLRAFPSDNFFPPENKNNPEAPLKPYICTNDFKEPLEGIADLIVGEGGGCINKPIFPCESPQDTVCPAFPYTERDGTCTLMPNSGGDSDYPEQFYCDSGVQIRARLLASVPNAAQVLEETGYCIEGSIAESSFPDGCVIRADKFEWVECPNGVPGLKFNWVDSNGQATEAAELEAQRALAGTEIQLRYNSLSSN